MTQKWRYLRFLLTDTQLNWDNKNTKNKSLPLIPKPHTGIQTTCINKSKKKKKVWKTGKTRPDLERQLITLKQPATLYLPEVRHPRLSLRVLLGSVQGLLQHQGPHSRVPEPAVGAWGTLATGCLRGWSVAEGRRHHSVYKVAEWSWQTRTVSRPDRTRSTDTSEAPAMEGTVLVFFF